MDIIQGLIETESIGRPMWRIVNNNGTFEILNNMSSNVIFSILNGGNIEVDTDVYNVITNYTEGNGGTSSQWTTSGVEIYYNSGNIGIGTNDPMTPLHIYNTSNTRLLLDTTTTSSASIEFRRGIGTDILTDFRFINDTNGYIKLQYENNTQTYSDTIANLAWFSSNETIIHKNTAINGRVGIGTTYHATRSLDVFGDANISGLMSSSNLSVLGSATITDNITNNTSLIIQNGLIPAPTITSSPSVITQNTGIYSYMVFTYTTETGGGGSGQTLYTAQAAGIICDILVVGGGGSGGNDRGGGGGGGGVIYQQNITLNGSYTIRVGKGGLGPTSGTGGGTGTRGINGINTSISGTNITTITTIGGGGGGSCNSGSIRDGLSGGSGGGGSQYNGYGSGGTGTAGQGRNGGTGFEPGAGGGGGGAVNVGVNATSTNAGNGGVGLSNTITGSTVIYGSGGGGGGTSPLNFGGTIKLPGTGGSSGAGNGGGVNANGTNATVYGCGGGGGGVANGATTKGGDGGSGVVILRIKRKIQIMAITNSFEGYYNEAPVSTIAMPPLRIQSNILTSFVYLQKGFYRFRADLGNMGRANPNIIYAELVIYDESNLSGAQYNCKKVFKYNLYNNRYRPSYLRQYIQIPTNKFYKLAYSYYYINNTTSNRNEEFKLYYRYLATAPESLEGSTPANLIAWYRFDGSIEDINPSTTLPKYHLVETKNRQPNYPDDTFQEKGYVNTNDGAFKTINNIDLAGKSFSISVWMRTKSNDHCYFICQGKQYWDEYRYYDNGYLHIGHRGNGQYVLGFWNNDLEHNSSGGRAYPEDANQWVHMVFVVDVALNRASCGRRMYRNGALIAEDRNRALYNGQGKLYIGQLATWGEQYYNYNMDISDFMVFDKALTGSEAAQLFNNTPNPSEVKVDTTTVSLSSANNDTLFSTNAINSINTPMDTFLFNGVNVNTGYKSSTARNVFSTIGYTNKDYVSFQNLATYLDTDSIDYFGIRILTSRRNVEQRLIDGEGARLTNEIAGSTRIANLNALTKAIKGIDYKGLLPVGNPQLLPSKTFISIFGRGNEANYITIDKVRDLNNLANPGLTDAVYVEALN